MGRSSLSNSRTYVVGFICIWLGLLAVGREKMLRDPGTFWHTVVGEDILTTMSLPRADGYSFTCLGHPWIAQQWLGEIGMAVVHRVAGLDGLLAVAAGIIAMVYAGVGARLRQAEIRAPVVGVVLMLLLAASAFHFFPRPHLGTLAGMYLCYSMLGDVESGRARWSRLLWLPVVMVVWTNVHGGALGGLATILFVLIGWLVRPMDGRSTIMVGVAAACCIVAVLVNPYGAALPALWVGLMGSIVLPQLMIEHAPLKLLSADGVMVVALAGVYLVVLARSWPANRRVTWLIPLVWLVMTLSRVRHGPLFAITAGIAIAEMAPFARLGGLMEPGKRDRGWWGAIAGLRVAPCGLMLLVLLVQRAGLPVPVVGKGWARPPADYWPIETTEALASLARESPGRVRLFNDMLFGGYLIYRAPWLPVYLDDRCELYGDQGLLTYTRACADPAYFDAIAAYENLDAALVIARTTLDAHLASSAGWRRLASDHASSLYVRTRG